ncbi:hypothetical protein C4J98_1394 [Pseudomonas orientalis]|uniref:DUF3757 domain-containing protein n=1 Tax=Pseudomonas orientalis TaxID=76758 RepID=UPI000F569FDE|nr:DUF3757 domain-containing protein [Pseudomonas orientalis]AZE82822.1 hypothetical protein C4J98_1394 [Pseudomonas orientalis]
MFKQSICVLLLGICAIGQAGAQCPENSVIIEVKGRYQFHDGDVLWRGPKARAAEFIRAFSGATFAPDEEDDRKSGVVEKCIYESFNGRIIVLRPSIFDGAKSMSLSDSSFWEDKKISSGQQIYVCKQNLRDNCAFTVNNTSR